jgi:ATP-dependent Clp protease adaptor protein ClpS
MEVETLTETFVDPIEEILKEYPNAIILYNDDYNTFNHVIDCLVAYCRHTPLQAEQCANIVHYKGKCDVKHGCLHQLEPICAALQEQGLEAKIE